MGLLDFVKNTFTLGPADLIVKTVKAAGDFASDFLGMKDESPDVAPVLTSGGSNTEEVSGGGNEEMVSGGGNSDVSTVDTTSNQGASSANSLGYSDNKNLSKTGSNQSGSSATTVTPVVTTSPETNLTSENSATATGGAGGQATATGTGGQASSTSAGGQATATSGSVTASVNPVITVAQMPQERSNLLGYLLLGAAAVTAVLVLRRKNDA